jgi:hypothetical protein
MTILGWRADDGACGHYRIAWPWAAMAEAGADVRQHHVLSPQEMIDAELTVCQRVTLPIPARVMTTAAQHGAKLAFETDDLLWRVDPSNSTFAQFQVKEIRAAIEEAIEACVGFVVSTKPLAEEVRVRYPGMTVVVLENGVPDYMAEVERPEHEGVRVVWAGSPTHGGDFSKDVKYGLKKLTQRTDVEVHCLGHDYSKQLGVAAQVVPWSEDMRGFHLGLGRFDIGLCPLAPTRFNRAKSGIKAMEYQAAGVVPVATDCEAYRNVITDGETGFLVRTQWEWADRLTQLAQDHALRTQMAQACQSLTAGRTYRQRANEWLSGLNQL